MRRECTEPKIISAALFVLLAVAAGHAQLSWARTYGGTNNDFGNSIEPTLDGGYVIAGTTSSFGAGNYDVYLVKLNASGDTIWTRTYGGPGDDEGYFAQQTSDGGYVVAGYTSSFGAGNDDVYLVKTDGAGDTLWTRTYGGTGNDVGYSAQQTSDGGYIVAGYTSSFGAGLDDVYLVKTNGAGDTLWTRTYGGLDVDIGYSVQPTADGGYIIAGSTIYSGAIGYVYVVKTNAAGDTLWTRTYRGDGDVRGYSVQQTADGGYIIAGSIVDSGVTGYVYLIKTNASGDTLWTRTYGEAQNSEGNSVQQTSDGGYVVAGFATSNGTGGCYVYLIKTNASGDTLWTRTYGGDSVNEGNFVRQTTDGGYVIAGLTNSFGAGNYDVYVIKTDGDGRVGVEEQGSSKQVAAGSVKATPNPFAAFTRIPGHEAERFNLYDISGKMVGTFPGDRIGEGLSPAVYFIERDGNHGGRLRVVKIE
jgi:hypothetical protein